MMAQVLLTKSHMSRHSSPRATRSFAPGRKKRTIAALFVTAWIAAATIGCGPSESEDAAANGSDAISQEEAAKQLNLKRLVLDEPASSQAQKELGLSRWYIYVNIDKNHADTVAFATDKDGDVRYALVAQAKERSETILEYEKSGIKADQ